MAVERTLVVVYLLVCVAIGIMASRRVLGSGAEYWVAGRRISTGVNAVAIMAALASGGSIIGVMGLAYGRGIPFALSLFAGAVVGFPLASILVARPLRNFGRFTITDFLAHRYPGTAMRVLVPALIVVSFTAYIVAQMKAAGITAELLLGIPYQSAVGLAAIVFIAYVSIGGMVAVTWTDLVQGALMLLVVCGIALAIALREGSPLAMLDQARGSGTDLGAALEQPLASYIGSFVVWAAAIPVIPHIVMRVFSARDARSARISLNLAMIAFSGMVLLAVLVIVPYGAATFSDITDPDTVFLRVMEEAFPPVVRGLAVAAVMAAVMSTTDALLLACSSAIAHDLLGHLRLGARARSGINIATVWVVGLVAMVLALSPPDLLTELYSVAIGLLSAALFVPTVAGLWWKGAGVAGGVASAVAGAGVYLIAELSSLLPPLSVILVALPASALAMWAFARKPPDEELLESVRALHAGRTTAGRQTERCLPS